MTGLVHGLVHLLLPAASRTEVGDWRWTDLPPAWVLTVAAVVLFLVFRALYRRERGRAGRPTRLALAVVRTVVLLLLVLVLAGPYREEVRTAEERAHLVLLLDTSASMSTADRYGPEDVERLREVLPPDTPLTDVTKASRLSLVQEVLTGADAALLREMDRRFVLHAYAFDVDWRGLGATKDEAVSGSAEEEGEDAVATIADGIGALGPTGSGTSLGGVLRGVASEFLGREDRRLAGVLLVTDGRDTSEGDGPLDVLAGLGTLGRDLHVTPVALGNPSTGRNVRVERIRAKDVVLLEDDVVFETALRHQGFAGLEDVGAEIGIEKVADAENRPLVPPQPYEPPPGTVTKLEELRLGTEDEPTPIRFQVRMREAGTFRVSVRVLLPPEARDEDAIRDDDVATHDLRVVDQQIKVLLVDDQPRYEMRFLGNWLTREPEPDPTRPERRRRYEAQVLQQRADPTVDQPASPGLPALRRFPRTRRDLFEYDVLILGDVDWMKLGDTAQESREILRLIRDFVEEGGGLALQAGEEYNNPLGFRDTPLQELLPISPRDRDRNVSEKKDTPFRLELTDVGRYHPIFGVVPGEDGGIATAEEVTRAWRGEAPYSWDWRWYWLYRATGGLRPGALALARARPSGPLDKAFLDDTGKPVVAMAAMGYGRGRVFWTALDNLWRIRRGQSDRFYGPFWDQVIRHLATYRLLGGNRRFKIATDKETYFAGESAAVTITALDRDFEPMVDPFLDGVHVVAPDGEDTLLEGDLRPRNASTEGAAPGTYRFLLRLPEKGMWRIWIGEDAPGRTRGPQSRAERRIQVEFRAAEQRQTAPDHELLEAVRDATDGRTIGDRLARLYDLGTLASELPARTTQRVLDRRERTQWDKSWVLLLLVGLLGLEWAIRKRSQMI